MSLLEWNEGSGTLMATPYKEQCWQVGHPHFYGITYPGKPCITGQCKYVGIYSKCLEYNLSMGTLVGKVSQILHQNKKNSTCFQCRFKQTIMIMSVLWRFPFLWFWKPCLPTWLPLALPDSKALPDFHFGNFRMSQSNSESNKCNLHISTLWQKIVESIRRIHSQGVAQEGTC